MVCWAGAGAPTTETLIVVPLEDGYALASNVHLPAASRATNSCIGDGIEWLEDRLARNNGVPPYEWPSMCDELGLVYVQGGLFLDAPVCGACLRVQGAVTRHARRVAA